MYNPIQERRQEIIDNINKSFVEEQTLEKAKWQIGEVRVDSRGIAHECFEYTADGKPHLRRVKKQGSASPDATGVRSNGLTAKEETKITNNLESQLDTLFPNKLGRISKIKIEKKKDYIEATIDSASKSKNPNNPFFQRSIVRSKDGGENWEVFSSNPMRWSEARKKDVDDNKKGDKEIGDFEFKKIVNILEKKNPSDFGAERYLEPEEMDDKQLDNFIKFSEAFANDEENINALTRRRCEVWHGLALKERKERKDKLKAQLKQPKTLSEAQKGDTVAIIMDRYNPQLGDYVVIKKGTITKKAAWGFTVDDGSGYLKTYSSNGDEKKSKAASYGSVKYTIMTEDEMRSKIKDGKFRGTRISQNYFDDKK